MYTLNEYQKQAHSTATYEAGVERFTFEQLQCLCNLSYAVHGLTGEAGESAEKVKKFIRAGDFQQFPLLRTQLTKELGDCLWYISEAAQRMVISLDDLARTNLEKLKDRKARGVLHGSGDDR